MLSEISADGEKIIREIKGNGMEVGYLHEENKVFVKVLWLKNGIFKELEVGRQ